ncbi:decaprenyl-phosphate phosphoribosyltransferase [Marinivivus vitaminiproducens]|uniref:decaprenyl-phosphate phosphoribosyltransferase n=1 Tax=Marinivivus vitaminiproducens TaxID=3035935 RepID=UPI0027A38744|nr:decaprenyl-phosphate phosphoribosyltransferase [Geminicoccaceae bacterium SCSIO 64248]
MRQPAALALLRPHQWIKNLFVAAPLFFTPSELTAESVVRVLLGMVCFCVLASAVYILNDYADREADRRHPEKCMRPLAAGTVSVSTAFALMAVLFVGGTTVAFLLSPTFALLALVYFGLNLGYSFGLKHFAIVDVMIIAFGFILRVEGGARLIEVAPSAWIVIATGLLALFLAIAKRRDDLVRSLGQDHRRSLDGYNKPFLDTALAVILGALLVAYMVYTTDVAVMERLGTPKLFYTAPFVVAGILRYLQITLVEERSGSPTKIVLTDRFLIVTVLGWALVFGALIYG